ncbi:helix-turn-helix domain-containing protein [Streptomyces sp. NPDC002623]
MMGAGTRELIVAEYRATGLSPDVIGELIAEVGPLWHERHQARLTARPRRRAVGTGAKHRFVFVDRLLATLVSLRHGTTHDVLAACWFGVDRSTVTRAIGEVRPLLAQRGCTGAPGVRLCALAEVIEHPGADSGTGITDGTEIRVRRPVAGRKDRGQVRHAIGADGSVAGGTAVRPHGPAAGTPRRAAVAPCGLRSLNQVLEARQINGFVRISSW